jgi:hypothetical protein
MKLTLQRIDWFKSRGFLLGRDKSREVYYVVDGGTGKRYDFGSIEQCQQFVENMNAYRYQTDHVEERL